MDKSVLVRVLASKARMAKGKCEEARKRRGEAVEEAAREQASKSVLRQAPFPAPTVSGQEYNLHMGRWMAYRDAIREIREAR